MDNKQHFLENGPQDFVVRFDHKNGNKYACCISSMGAAVTGIGLVCLPIILWWTQKEFDSQKCKITDKRIIYESGWLNRSTKSIPLDRIQDVNVQEGCLQRMYGIKGIEIQTAGSGTQFPEAYMVAPLDATMVRDVIMERRDQLVLGPNGVGASRATASGGGLDDIKRSVPPVTVAEDIRELRDAVLRIEASMHSGIQQLQKIESGERRED